MSTTTHEIEHEVYVEPDGRLRFVYSDDLLPLLELGRHHVVRVAAVEPHSGGGWRADCSRWGGPVLGPYATRADGLAGEARAVRCFWDRIVEYVDQEGAA